ncbi:HAAS signaling domain-containing protein [Phenylobacterium sp.]|jgi:uncharacterized membrane protein|uniref:HAAS signaling domain-containing protein n=1 Tax=Phenylobacterium sp. TaxID=1871053 RepID=UPI002F427B1F
MSNDAGKAHLDCYLDQVRRNLKVLPSGEVEEIVAELRSHVLDKVEGTPTPERVEAAIAALGSPREVARLNLTERVAAEVDEDRSPLTVLRGVGRLAGLSMYGAFTGLVCFVGYATAAAFLITAVVKPFAWRHTGLWRIPNAENSYSWMLGVTDNPRHGQELLGGWIIPISLAAGLILGWLTWRFGLFSVRRMRRSARRGRA